MKYILDTSFVSELMKGSEPAVARLAATRPENVSVPHPVFAEIAYGIERLPPSNRRTRLQERFDVMKAQFPRTEWSDAVSETFGRIKTALEKRGYRIEDFDAAIAAHAVASGATLVTANIGQMVRVPGLRVEDWTTESR